MFLDAEYQEQLNRSCFLGGERAVPHSGFRLRKPKCEGVEVFRLVLNKVLLLKRGLN